MFYGPSMFKNVGRQKVKSRCHGLCAMITRVLIMFYKSTTLYTTVNVHYVILEYAVEIVVQRTVD